MTVTDIRNLVMKKFRIGQKVTLQINDAERYGGDRITVNIMAFYPESVLTERNDIKESFRYFDFLKATIGIEEVVLEKKMDGHHKIAS